MVDNNDPKLKRIRRAVGAYHYALDRDEDAHAATRRTIDAIQEIMGQPCVLGAVVQDRRRRFTWEPGDLVVVESNDSIGS